MTLDEARAELGIDAAATPEKARRAYLRGIKTRKPETDPEGFRRLREAYEIATGVRGQTPAAAPAWADPEPWEPAEPQGLDPSQDPNLLALRAQGYLSQSRLREAVEALGEALDRLQELPCSEYRTVPVWLPRGLLALEAAGKAEEARALYDRLRSWLAGTGDTELIDLWNADDQWRLLEEIADLDESFPPELRRAAARAGLLQDVSPAVEEAGRYAERDPEEAEAVAILLIELPMLRDLYASILAGDRPSLRREKKKRKQVQRWRLLLYFAVALAPFLALILLAEYLH